MRGTSQRCFQVLPDQWAQMRRVPSWTLTGHTAQSGEGTKMGKKVSGIWSMVILQNQVLRNQRGKKTSKSSLEQVGHFQVEIRIRDVYSVTWGK